jgi:uncharacterized protein YggE
MSARADQEPSMSRAFIPVAFAGVLLLGIAASPATAQPPPAIAVTGQGTVVREPDRATLSATIVTSSEAAATATSQNNGTYDALRSRLHAIGIPESSIRTLSYDVTYVPKPPPNATYTPPHTGYVATRPLQITIDDLSLVGKALDATVAAGVTQIEGVAYGLRDRRAAYAEALADAVRDAQAQASALAAAAHVRLGPIRRIQSGFSPAPPAPLLRAAVSPAAAPNVPTEITPSQIEVRATVQVTYSLAP